MTRSFLLLLCIIKSVEYLSVSADDLICWVEDASSFKMTGNIPNSKTLPPPMHKDKK